jgi:hypothetical protein
MADGTLQILGLGTSAVPLDYTASGDQALDLVAVNADYNGGGAGVDWQPVVEIISTAGHVMARGVGPTITAGDSASVTFAPFLKTAETDGGGSGIQYDVENVGDWFWVETTDGHGGWGINLTSEGTSSGQGILIQADGTLDNLHLFVTNDSGGMLLEDGGGGIIIREEAGFGHVSIQDHGSGGTEIHTDSYLDVQAAQRIFLNLPTSPGAAGSLWNSAGTVKVA